MTSNITATESVYNILHFVIISHVYFQSRD